MNYKSSAGDALPIGLLSYFHRGFFWGIICSWLAGMSFAVGAVATKSIYLDRQNYQLASRTDISLANQNISTPISSRQLKPNSSNLSSRSTKTKNRTGNFNFLIPKVSLLQRKIASFVPPNYSQLKFLNSFLKHAPSHTSVKQEKKRSDKLISKFEQEKDSSRLKFVDSGGQLTYVVDSTSGHDFLDKFASAHEIKSFKQSKIIILDSPDYPGLAEFISAYLWERDFTNTEVSYHPINQVITSLPAVTTIRANGADSKSANYLKTILGFGDLELIPSEFSQINDSSELILLLGDDAQVFSKNQGFVSYVR